MGNSPHSTLHTVTLHRPGTYLLRTTTILLLYPLPAFLLHFPSDGARSTGQRPMARFSPFLHVSEWEKKRINKNKTGVVLLIDAEAMLHLFLVCRPASTLDSRSGSQLTTEPGTGTSFS